MPSSAARNATADSHVCTSRPATSKMKASESRTAGSSSMTWTVPSSAMLASLPVDRGQCEAERRAAVAVRFRPKPSAMGFDDGAGNRQADSHAAALGGDEGLKQLVGNGGADAGARVGHADLGLLRRDPLHR